MIKSCIVKIATFNADFYSYPIPELNLPATLISTIYQPSTSSQMPLILGTSKPRKTLCRLSHLTSLVCSKKLEFDISNYKQIKGVDESKRSAKLS